MHLSPEAVFGFAVAAYSIVANDAIQTLGTFLSSNSHRSRIVLWLFCATILFAVLLYGWSMGDVSYARLEKFPVPEGGITWWHTIPAVVIVLLTRFGIPVSTTFIILTVFAVTNLEKMLVKSLLGYAVAFVSGFGIYMVVARWLRRMYEQGGGNRKLWVVLQWISTGFLWSMWLIQDLANIYVYLPRQLSNVEFFSSCALMLALLGFIIYNRGGKVQHIVATKVNTSRIQSATIIDFIYGIILYIFKDLSNMPMSTTWVFLGLLAGREMAITRVLHHQSFAVTGKLILRDAGKAGVGLAVSVGLALLIPQLAGL